MNRITQGGPLNMRTSFASCAGLVIAAALTAASAGAHALTADEARDIAIDTYIYGYSLISVEMSRKVITNVEKPTTTRAPMGQFAQLREYPNASYRDVTAPNADTLYSNAFVDVAKEPWVVSWPDMGERYYVWEFYNAWVPVVMSPARAPRARRRRPTRSPVPDGRARCPQA